MPLVLASAHLSDEEFLEAFHSCGLPNSEFHHADHLRLAWLHLQREPLEIALAKVREGIQNFAAHHGAAHLLSRNDHDGLGAAAGDASGR